MPLSRDLVILLNIPRTLSPHSDPHNWQLLECVRSDLLVLDKFVRS